MTLWLAASLCLRSGKAACFRAQPILRRASHRLPLELLCGQLRCFSTVQHLYDKAKNPCRANLRQVHLVEEELILELKALGFCVAAGDLGENITTRHVRLTRLDAGTVL